MSELSEAKSGQQMNDINTILFDYCGVITDRAGHGSKDGLLAKALGSSVAEIDAIAEPFYDLVDAGKFSETDFWSKLEQELGKKIPNDARYWYGINDDKAEYEPRSMLIQYVKKLKRRGFRTAILSNIGLVTTKNIAKNGWYALFDPVFLSCEVGLVKPNLDFYEYAVQQLDVQSQRVIFVDDKDKNLIPARQLGMRTILAESAEQIIADVESLIPDRASV